MNSIVYILLGMSLFCFTLFTVYFLTKHKGDVGRNNSAHKSGLGHCKGSFEEGFAFGFDMGGYSYWQCRRGWSSCTGRWQAGSDRAGLGALSATSCLRLPRSATVLRL